MKSVNDVIKFFKNAAISTNSNMDETVLDKVLIAHEKTANTTSAAIEPNIRRTIMKNPILKLAAVAVIIALVVLGLFEFIETENTSGVVWADVARKVQASRGMIVRCTESFPSTPESLSFLNDFDYAIKYFSPTHSRTDSYKDGQIVQTYYTDHTDADTETLTGVYHKHKHYISHTYEKSGDEFLLEQHEHWMNPRYLTQAILSCEHRKLGQKTIDGVLCEGIETTDPACLGPLPGPVDRLEVEFRLWVNVETQYPVMFEWKVNAEAEGQVVESDSLMDQFQWDVELDPNFLQPNIPPDYVDMRTL